MAPTAIFTTAAAEQSATEFAQMATPTAESQTSQKAPPFPGSSLLPTPTPMASTGEPARQSSLAIAATLASTTTPAAAVTPTPQLPPLTTTYTVRGDLVLTTQAGDGEPVVQRYGYEVSVSPSTLREGYPEDRRLRLIGYEEGAPTWQVSTIEVGDTAVTYSGQDAWRVQTRSSVAPLSRALQPVLDLAEFAYQACSLGGDGTGAGGMLRSDDVCVFTGSDVVAALLAAYDKSVRVTSSVLAVQVDPVARVTTGYLLTADVEKPLAGAEPTTISIEWSYERADASSMPVSVGIAGAFTNTTGIGTAGIGGNAAFDVFPSNALAGNGAVGALPGANGSLDLDWGRDLASEIFEPDTMPASERTLALAQVGDVLHVELAAALDQARTDLETALQDSGWTVRERESALLADRKGDTLVVFLAEGATADSTATDLVPVD